MKIWLAINLLIIILGVLGVWINAEFNPPYTWKYKIYSTHLATLGAISLVVEFLYTVIFQLF